MGSSTRVLQVKKIRYSPIQYESIGVYTLKDIKRELSAKPFWNLVMLTIASNYGTLCPVY